MEILQVVIAGVFSLSVGLGSVFLKHILDNRKKKKEEIDHENLTEDEIINMTEIQKFIEDFRYKMHLDRIGIFQFHNGSKFFQGIPMKKYSQTFEATSPGIASTKSLYQNILVTEHPGFMKALCEKDIISFSCKDENIEDLRECFEEQGILQTISAPIRSLSGQLIGFIDIQCIKHEIDLTSELEDEIYELVASLSGYLSRKK